jgi:ribulose-5-phosphate 4-epimerase/fuculose-1-phosphate aldolase
MSTKSIARFETVFLDERKIANEKSKELVNWCKRFKEAGLVEKEGSSWAGNLSFRSEHGMVITPSGKDIGKIKEENLVEVVECNATDFEVKCIGLEEPSSESFIHWKIYELRPEINAVLHGHSKQIVENAKELGLAETKQFQDFGTLELLKEIINVLSKRKLIVVKKHGFIVMGQNIEDAGKLAMQTLEKAKALEKKDK